MHMYICEGSGALRAFYSLNFTEDREIGSCMVLLEGCGLETEHKSGQSLCFSLSPSSNAPSTQAHSLHSRPSNLSTDAERSSMYQEEETFERRMPNIAHLKTILYPISLNQDRCEHCICSCQFQTISLVAVVGCAELKMETGKEERM